MAVKIRLSRVGKKNRPYWRIVVMDSRSRRDGAFLAHVGSYDPIKHEILNLDQDLIKEWMLKGAQCSLAVEKLVKRHQKSL